LTSPKNVAQWPDSGSAHAGLSIWVPFQDAEHAQPISSSRITIMETGVSLGADSGKVERV
jgi:hypothetical protein